MYRHYALNSTTCNVQQSHDGESDHTSSTTHPKEKGNPRHINCGWLTNANTEC